MNNKELTKNLRSEKTETVITTLKYISTDGNKEIMPEVINLLHHTKSTLVRDEIIKILENLKDQNSTQALVNAIKDINYKDELSVLVSACWKNGLNFEEHIETFIDVFIQADFQLAFDAFTVIDNFNIIDHKKAEQSLIKLGNTIEDTSDSKRPLFFELMNIIENKKENPAR
ncbi:MAG: hypothetical protein ACLFVR_02310 [Thiohalospira sp.]